MQSYNLDQQAGEAESFDFILGGNTYHFRYPTTEEVNELTKLKNPNGTIDVDKMMKTIYTFITPATAEAPGIEGVVNSSNIRKFKEFQRMMLTELGLQES